MTHRDWRHLAAAVADGVEIGPGSRVSVTLTSTETVEAAEALVTETYKRGAYAQVLLVDERFDRAALRYAPLEVVGWTPELEARAMQWADVHVALRGMVPPEPSLDIVDDARVAEQRVAKGRISTLRWQSTRWCVVRIPTAAWAQYLGIAESKMLDEFFAGSLLDWGGMRTQWQELADRLESASLIRIVAPGTDLTFNVTGRRWILFAGVFNMPDGEVATAPIEDGVDGHITFDDPLVFAGREIRGLRLRIAAGRVVCVSAQAGEGVVRQLISADMGASRVGELGIGLNDRITTWTRDLFIDEKILGTVHLALGRAYPECGGTNMSTIHWDIVKDLRIKGPSRPGGSLLVDGVPLIDDGAFEKL